MPIVLLINKVGVVPLPAGVDRTYDGVMDHLKADVDRFTAASEIPVVGCFLRARGNLDLDSTIDCVSELMDGIERSRKRPTLAPEYGLTEDIDGCGFLAPGADAGCFGA